MHLLLESTDKIVDVDGAQCRVWTGVTRDGVQCVAFVRRVAVRGDQPRDDFDRDLSPRPQPTPGPANAIAHEILG